MVMMFMVFESPAHLCLPVSVAVDLWCDIHMYTHTYTRARVIGRFSVLVFRMSNIRLNHVKFHFHRSKTVPYQ